MTSHDNVHIPKESWPKFSWFLIEFALVIVVALVIAWQTSPPVSYTHLTLPTILLV